MKRMFFTSEDLTRVRIGAPLGALAETMLATRVVQRSGPVVFDGWRNQVRSSISDDFAVLADILPPDDDFVDLIIPTRASGARSMSEGLEALYLASRDEIRREVDSAAQRRIAEGQKPLPAWTEDLADRSADALREVGTAAEAFHSVAFGGRWEHIQSYLDVAADRMARTMATEGVERLFAGLPYLRWQAPMLEIYKAQHCHDDHLNGRGLVIVPSLFAGSEPLVLHSCMDKNAPKMLIVPVLRNAAEFAAAWGPRATNETLNALLGRTRAAALQEIAEGRTTTELARRLNVSPATASEHASILRQAGLIESRRHRNTMRHELTTLGAAMLDGGLGAGLRIA